MIKVKKGQDPYSVIGQYIRDHVSAIEDVIAVIEIDGKTSNELFMVDMTVDGYFIWRSDWYEGEENVVLIDFFPVSDACNPKNHWIPVSERLPKELEVVNVTWVNHEPEPYYESIKNVPFTASAVYYKGKWYWYSSITEEVLAEYGKYESEEFDDAIECIAWMPLPEPYKEGEQDE